jgi:hypothetical protein
MRHGLPTVMIGSCPERADAGTRRGMIVMLALENPYIEATLAAERRGRFLAEVTRARQIAQLAPVPAGKSPMARFAITMRAATATGTAWMGSLRPTRRQRRLSPSGES